MPTSSCILHGLTSETNLIPVLRPDPMFAIISTQYLTLELTSILVDKRGPTIMRFKMFNKSSGNYKKPY